MTYNEMQDFINSNRERICDSDAYFIQFKQADAAYRAILADIERGSSTAATDLMIFTIGNQAFPVSCFNAETISLIDEMLIGIMQNAVEEIYLMDTDKIV